MKPLRWCSLAGWLFAPWFAVLSLQAQAPAAAEIPPMKPKRVLFFTKSSGWEHSVIKKPPGGGPSFAGQVLAELGPRIGLEFVESKDGGRFSPEYLAGFDVFLFYTSGDLSSVGTDGHPAVTAEGKQALLDAVAGGKGFVGLHSASDSWHTGEGAATAHRVIS